MFRATSPSKLFKYAVSVLLAVTAPISVGEPGDEVVEQYLRENRMDTLLEVQLEERLEQAESDEERTALGEELSSLYLRQLRELNADDPYRELTINRAISLVNRLDQVPLYDLRLELQIISFVAHEQDIELYRLGLLERDRQLLSRQAMTESARAFDRISASIEPELSRLDRRRAQPMGSEEAQATNNRIDELRRFLSLASYYKGWSEYALAVLDDRHVGDDAFIAFGRLLGADGVVPQSKDLPRAAVEYEHVARSAIGIAMCHAQSESASLAITWIDTLLGSDELTPDVRQAAQSRKLQILAGAGEWYEAEVFAREILRERGQDASLTVPDARFIAMKALDQRANRSASRGNSDSMNNLARLGLEQLVELGEIGHIVDLYSRYGSLPLLKEGFIPNYAQALGALNAADAGEANPGYLAIAELFSQALKSGDASDYPKQREDCTLKFAYALIRGDRPQDAIEPCNRVLNGSLDPDAKQEARWLMINAFDRINVLANRGSSPELDEAVRAYIEAYPSTSRTAKLILRYAMRGTIDDTVAIDTLSAISDDDPIAIPARRTLVRLIYEQLRTTGFTDQQRILDARRRIVWLTHQPPAADSIEDSRARLDILRLGIDLALRSVPPDVGGARMMIEQARSMLDAAPDRARIEGELAYQDIQIALFEKRQDQAVALIEPLRQIDEQRANDAEVLVLNALIDLWSNRKDARLAGFVVKLGSPVLSRVTPKAPAQIGLQTSALIETVAHAALLLAETGTDEDQLEHASRLSRQILDRGQPSEPGLRRTAQIAAELKDAATELEAWLRLLAAYQPKDDEWFEARYQSLALMQRLDPVRAKQTFVQFKVLNPELGPAPWNTRIAELFAEPIGQDP